MITLLWFWLGWHALLLVLASIRATPARWWIRCHAMHARIVFWSRVWVGIVPADGWVGYYWDQDKRRLFVSLCPYVVLRLEFATRDPAKGIAAIFRAAAEAKRAQVLPAIELARELSDQVGGNLNIGTREEALVSEACERLRAYGMLERLEEAAQNG